MSFIGPALPPHLMRKQEPDPEEKSDEESSESKGSSDKSFIGPAMPPHLMSKQSSGDVDSDQDSQDKPDEKDEDDAGSYGPALPPGFQPPVVEEKGPKIIGPCLPPGFSLPSTEIVSDGEDNDDGFTVGPMPAPAGTDPGEYMQQLFESRAERMQKKIADKNAEKVPTRESWMIELPKDRYGQIGLGARSFRKNAGPDRNADTSDWTDMPADKLRKAKNPREASGSSRAEDMKAMAIKQRDESMAKEAAKHSKKRSSESLLDSHQKKLEKKKKEEAEKPKQRQMFDREKDLQVNKFDEAQKKAVFNKAKLLNDRFSSGGQKYL